MGTRPGEPAWNSPPGGRGVIDWLAPGAERRGACAVLAGNLVVQILSLLVVLRTA